MRMRHVSVAIMALATVTAGGTSASSALAAGRTVSGQVLYGFQACTSASVSSQVGVPAAELLLRPARGPAISMRLDSGGHFRVRVPNALPVKAWLVLSSSQLAVAPLESGAGAYHIPLGAIAFRHGRALVLRRRLVLTTARYDGAANVWTVLHQAGVVATSASPVHLPALTARWTYGEDLTAGTTHYEPSRRTIFVGAVPVTTALGEWEPTVLFHEFGHFLLDTVAPSNSPGGDHAFNSVEPQAPALAWDEGFADAFAAIMQRDPVVKVNCRWQADMSTAPAHPLPSTKLANGTLVADPNAQSEAQYNEGAIAGTLWHLAEYLAPGSPQKALKPILSALHAHPADSMRAFRDALAEDPQIESTATQQDVIDGIFSDQSIGWGIGVLDDFYGNAPGIASAGCTIAENNCYVEVGFKVDGPSPYDPCKLANDLLDPLPPYWSGTINGVQAGFVGSPGGLGFAPQSGCQTTTDGFASGATDPGQDPGEWNYLIGFPYAPGASLDAKFTLSVMVSCIDATDSDTTNCPTSDTEELDLANGFDYSATGVGYIADNWPPPPGTKTANVVTTFDPSLTVGQWTPVVSFDEMGHCTVISTKENCSD